MLISVFVLCYIRKLTIHNFYYYTTNYLYMFSYRLKKCCLSKYVYYLWNSYTYPSDCSILRSSMTFKFTA